MDFEKIKDFISEKRNYIIIVIVILVGIFFFKKENEPEPNSASQNAAVSSSLTNKARSSSESSLNTAQSASVSKTVTCDISGAVKHEGVYTLKNGARLEELIAAAGGVKPRAQLKAINRAVMLKDQDKIHIPYQGEKVENATTVSQGKTANNTAASTSSTPAAGSTSQAGDKVNLNTASAADLQKLNGIGEKKAEKILAYRQEKGSFKKIEDLKQVSGIGDKTFASLKDQLAV